MGFKQFFINKLTLFFMLTTLITIAVSVLGSALDADARFGYDAFLSPLVFAGCCVLPSFVTYSKRGLKPKEMIPRMVLEFLLIEAVVLGLAAASPAIDTGRSSVVLALAGSVLVIYLLACLFEWLKDSAEAKKMNEDLLKFQKLHES